MDGSLGTSCPTGTNPPGTGTGTGGITPTSTGSHAAYANATSALPPTPQDLLVESPTQAQAYPLAHSHRRYRRSASNLRIVNIHKAPTPASTGFAPPVTVTQPSTLTVAVPPVTVTQSSTLTVTVMAAGFCASVSIAPFSSAPYPIPGNGPLGYLTGASGTGARTGSLPIGTGASLPILHTFVTTGSPVSVSAPATALPASLEVYT